MSRLLCRGPGRTPGEGARQGRRALATASTPIRNLPPNFENKSYLAQASFGAFWALGWRGGAIPTPPRPPTPSNEHGGAFKGRGAPSRTQRLNPRRGFNPPGLDFEPPGHDGAFKGRGASSRTQRLNPRRDFNSPGLDFEPPGWASNLQGWTNRVSKPRA